MFSLRLDGDSMNAKWKVSPCQCCDSRDTTLIGDPLAGEVECIDCGSIYFADKQTTHIRKTVTA